MIKALLILSLVICGLAAVDYCELTTPKPKLFISPKEVRFINLNSFIQGYDLTYNVSDVAIAAILPAYSVISKQELVFGGNFSVIQTSC